MTWVIAHRGASVERQENTLPAFERAIELGADFVELDVQVSRRALHEARRRNPALRVVQHVGYGVSLRAAAGYAWAVGIHDRRVTRRGLRRARALGLETTVYTVNDARRMRALAAMEVGGVFTDDPALLRAVLRDCPGRAPEAPR